MTPEELAASIEAGVERYVFSTEPEDDFTPNINILAAPANTLPSDEQITTQFEALDANNIQIERTTTAAGTEAVGVSYTVRTGELRVRGVSVFHGDR